jgi:uncharacterized protein YciI
MNKLFIIVLRYIATIEKIDLVRSSHLKFLDEYYKRGNFIVSGRQNPVTGGIIISRGNNRSEIQEIIKLDPFYKENLAEFNIYEFSPNKCSDDVEFFKQFL